MRRKIPFTKIQGVFKERNYIVLSTNEEYQTSTTKLKYKCKNHLDKGILTITWADLQRGQGCKHCGLESRKAKRKLDLEFVKNAFEERNYLLLETEYKNNRSKMKYICPYHPDKIQTITYNSLRNGHGCNDCALNMYSGDNCYRWKGGITSLRKHLREKMVDWKKDTMKDCGYKCVISGERFDEIHHLYGFDLILEETLKNTRLPLYDEINRYTTKELDKLFIVCNRLHGKYGLGVCLTKEIHTEFHIIYGYGNNTPEQFKEFKLNYFKNNGITGEPTKFGSLFAY